MKTIRLILPASLCVLSRLPREVRVDVDVDVDGVATQRSILDALEAAHPTLRGTLRDVTTRRRRPLVRFFACERDVSHADADAALPDAIAEGREPFIVVAAIAGG